MAYTYRLLRQVLRTGQIDAAALVFKDFAELLARLSAQILAQDLLQNAPSKYAGTIRAGFFGSPPSMGTWVRHADSWSKQALTAADLLFPEIASLWRTPKEKRTALNAMLSERVVNWRNQTIGHGVRGADVGPVMTDLEGFLGQSASSMHAVLLPFADLWRDVRLLDAEGRPIMGADSIVEQGQGGHTFAETTSVILQRSDRQLDLRPWISTRRCQVCGQSEIYLYDSARLQKTIPDFRLINYERGHRYSLQFSADEKMAEHYQAASSLGTIEEKEGFDEDSLPEEVARMLDEQAVEHDYLSPVYLRTPLKTFIETSIDQNRGGVFWLQAPAHVGKSTFVRGLDPAFRSQFREDTLKEGLAVAVFYIRREYQFHLGQFADQLRDKLKEALEIRAQKRPLPNLSIKNPNPKALCEFFREFQQLGQRPLLIIIDGLDELSEESPSIADYLPQSAMMPPNVFLLATSRLQSELPTWLIERTGALHDALQRRIALDDVDYVALMDEYARKHLAKGLLRNEALLRELHEKSEGRFLYFAFLVHRMKDGDLKAEDIDGLADPAHLIPQYITALQQRYMNTAAGDLLQRVLLWLVATEEAYAAHNNALPLLAQTPWMGLPMEVLCHAVEGQTGMTPRLAYVLYLLKPLLATWRGDIGVSRYRLGIKGLREMIHDRHSSDLDQLYAHLIRRLLAYPSKRESPMSRPADLEWVADYFDGFATLLSSKLREEFYTNAESKAALKGLLKEFMDKGAAQREMSNGRGALSSYAVSQAIVDELARDLSTETTGTLHGNHLDVLQGRIMVLNEIGDIQGAIAESNRMIAKCEELRQQLGTHFNNVLVDALAHAYMNLGISLANTRDLRAAVAAQDQAISLWEGLRQQSVMQFGPDMVDNLAAAHMNRGNSLEVTEERLAAYGRAISLWEELRQQPGMQFLPSMVDGLACAYVNLGMAMKKTVDREATVAAYDEAINLWEGLLQQPGNQFPLHMVAHWAAAYTGRGNTRAGMVNLAGAVDDYEKSVDLWEGLREQTGLQFPPAMADGLARAYNDVGIALTRVNNIEAALAYFAKAINLWEGLRQQPGIQFTPLMVNALALTYKNRGITTNNVEEALAAYDQAVNLWEGLREQNSMQFSQEMADHLAWTYKKRDDTISKSSQ
ncbi:tetratricopeptide repeat protein [Herbaspirillum sp. GCM10030257]|uniref:tetratricopeptide repeat protein n=1 Tax=Herbaspirillum sp. GCM10030257 TaxID=3273393 RepID=UPI003607EDFB